MSSTVQQLFSLNLPLANFIQCQFLFKWKLAEMRIIILSSLPHPWFVNCHQTLLWLLFFFFFPEERNPSYLISSGMKPFVPLLVVPRRN